MASAVLCVFCDEVIQNEKLYTLTERGRRNLIEAAGDYNNSSAAKMFLIEENNEWPHVRFHNVCRCKFVCQKNRNSSKRKIEEERTEDESLIVPPKIPKHIDGSKKSSVKSSKITKPVKLVKYKRYDCIICGKSEPYKKSSIRHVTKKPELFRKQILDFLKIRKDDAVLERLTSQKDWSKVSYHRNCFQKYRLTKESSAAKDVWECFRERLDEGESFFLSELKSLLKLKLIERGIKPEVANSITNKKTKKLLMETRDPTFYFVSKEREPIIICSTKTVYDALKRDKLRVGLCSVESQNTKNEAEVIRNAAAVIKKALKDIPPITEYAAPKEVLLEKSSEFVPECLQKLLCWLFDDKLFSKGSFNLNDNVNLQRRVLSLSECIIYCSRRGRQNQVLPPFQLGLMLQLQHEFGSRRLIEIMNTYGLCPSYDELRTFLTSAAIYYVEKENGVPAGIIKRFDGGLLIQEGDDNIDVNCETIDGKNTYHSMARVVFQDQFVNEHDPNTNVRIPRLHSLKVLPNDAKYNGFNKAIRYQKPKQRPQPDRYENATRLINETKNSVDRTSRSNDLAWVLLRGIARSAFGLESTSLFHSQVIPMWTAFNTRISKPTNIITTTSYLPSIDEKPADLNTVYTVLKRGVEVAQACGQSYNIHTFDQQLYALAQDVKLNNPEEFSSTVCRLGGFHALTTFIACIGKLWGAGLREMLVGSNVFATGSVDQMLIGKQFKRSFRGLTLVFEALVQLEIKNFIIYTSEETIDSITSTLQEKINYFHQKYTQNQNVFEEISRFVNDIDESFIPVFDDFRAKSRVISPTFRYWDDCIEALQLMLSFVRAEREGNWEQHLASITAMLPYFFVCNRTNYSRYTPLYVLQMLNDLPAEAKKHFEEGHFSIKFTPDAFRGLWSDIGVEMTVIKDNKSESGIVGFTRQASALVRWALTRNVTAQYAKNMNERGGMDSNRQEKLMEEFPGRLAKDEEDVKAVIRHIETNMMDPFCSAQFSPSLINIADGTLVDDIVEDSMLNVVKTGNEMMKNFVSKRLQSSPDEKVGFFDKIKKSNLKTFSDGNKPMTSSQGRVKKKGAIFSPEVVYQRALALADSRPDVNLPKILSVPLTEIPGSLFKEDGSRRCTTKSDLLHVMEKDVESNMNNVKFLRETSICVIDAMAEIQAINMKYLKTFRDLGEEFVKRIRMLLVNYHEVHYIFDRYDDPIHPKVQERVKRYKQSTNKYNITPDRPIPDWRKVLANDENKHALVLFLCSYIENCLDQSSFGRSNKKVYLAGGYIDRLITKEVSALGVNEYPRLFSNHTEADTRVISHVNYVCSQYANLSIVVKSPDTDVLVLLVAHYEKFQNVPEVWFETGKCTATTDLKRYIPIRAIFTKLGSALSFALPAIHSLTGCDTTSSLFGIGKKKAFAGARKLSEIELLNISQLGNIGITEELIQSCSKFVACLYDTKKKFLKNHADLNAMRYELSLSKQISAENLPPSFPAFVEHLKRCNWQSTIWYNADKPIIKLPDPIGHGWHLFDGQLLPVYFDGPTSIKILQNFICDCSARPSSCAIGCSCTCQILNMPCCRLCKCSSRCSNTMDEEHNID